MGMIAAIAAGGATGAVLRHFSGAWMLRWLGGSFPFGTLFVNIVGSFVMGILVSLFALWYTPSPILRAFLTVGLLGGFTTFSTFSLDVMTLLERGDSSTALLYVLLSVGLSVGALAGGLALTREWLL